MSKTNVYKASYDDLSETTVNAESMKSAVEELGLARADAEPSMIRKIISGIVIPDPPTPKPKVRINVLAQMEYPTEQLPNTIAVRPTTAEVEVGTMFQLYAIDTDPLPVVSFVGWYIGTERIGAQPNFGYIIPEDATDPITIVAKYARIVPTEHTLTLETEMADGVTSVPASCVVRPDTSIDLNEGTVLALYAIVTDPTYKFVHWVDSEEAVLSTEPTYLYTMPNENTTITAVFDEV